MGTLKLVSTKKQYLLGKQRIYLFKICGVNVMRLRVKPAMTLFYLAIAGDARYRIGLKLSACKFKPSLRTVKAS
jgi:hypothetical protein